ncbi:MAG: hypothetical protein OHK0053_14820 [Microscillaceae bacterium]
MIKANLSIPAFIAFWLALGFVSGEEAQAQKIPRDSASALEKLQFIRPHTKLEFRAIASGGRNVHNFGPVQLRDHLGVNFFFAWHKRLNFGQK